MGRAIDSPINGVDQAVTVDQITCKQLRDVIRQAKDHFLANEPAYAKHASTMFARSRFKSQTLMRAAEMMAHHDKLGLLQAIYAHLQEYGYFENERA